MKRLQAPICLSPLEIEERLRSAGIQPTIQRISICRFVLCEADHPTAEEIHAWAEKNLAKISLATVYNTLKTLVEAGLLKEFRFPVSDKVVYDNNLSEHHHFFDLKTQKIFDVAAEDVKIQAQLGQEFTVQDVSLFMTGEIKKTSSLKR